VEASAHVSGAGEQFRPLHWHNDTCLPPSSLNATAGLSTASYASQRALIDALPPDAFVSAEVLTDAQLRQLLLSAQAAAMEGERVPTGLRSAVRAFAAPRSLLDEMQTFNTPSVAPPPPTAVSASGTDSNIACFTSHAGVAAAQRDEGPLEVWDVSQLASLGIVSNYPSTTLPTPSKGSCKERDAAQRGAVAEEISEGSNSSSNSNSSRDSSPPDLTAAKTAVMTPCGDNFSGDTRRATPRPDASVDIGEVVSATSTCYFEGPPAACAPEKQKNAVKQRHNGSRGNEVPSFDEQCRRWMRLIAHSSSSSPLHAQPLCLDCWSEACVLPLQQRVRLAVENVEALDAVLENHSEEKQSRLWTMLYDAPTDAAAALPTLRRSEKRREEAPPPLRACPATAVSLDAVAANMFGRREREWLETMATLATPHQQPPPPQQQGQCATRSVLDRETIMDAPSEGGIALSLSENDERNGCAPLQQQDRQHAQLHELVAELEEVRSQQAALDAQANDLLEVLQALTTDNMNLQDTTAPRGQTGSKGDVCDPLVETQVIVNVDAPPPPLDHHHPLPSSSSFLAETQTSRVRWAALAAAHNIREVQSAFTSRDEAVERQHAMHDLSARHAFISATPIDMMCFPIDVSGPIGMIAGLRLGLVPPYDGGSGGATHGVAPVSRAALATPAAATADASSPPTLAAGSAGLRGNHSHSSLDSTARTSRSADVCAACIDTAESWRAEEAVFLDGFVRRQVQYTQLLLSGHTSGAKVNRTRAAEVEDRKGTEASHGTHRNDNPGVNINNSSNSSSSNNNMNGDTANVRVSLAELNAACGYLLLLLNYLAQVNGFAFQTALLRPAGDHSTVALLKRVSRSATVAAASSRASTSSLNPLSFFGLFANAASGPGQANTTHAAAAAATSTPPWSPSSAARSSYTVDCEVDFYITDRLFAWRTFGAACVAVAACVRELSDALHESLRCWRLREGMARRHSCEGGAERHVDVSIATASTAAVVQNEVSWAVREGGRGGADAWATIPVSLPRMIDMWDASARPSSTASDRADDAGVAKAKGALGGNICSNSPINTHPPTTTTTTAATTISCGSVDPAAAAAAVPSPVPLHPPYRILNDTVDGFSIRHGAVSELIWTLAMKKLLANVQWCAGATAELERLHAVSGDVDGSDGDGRGWEDGC
jgi:hypothetical protein